MRTKRWVSILAAVVLLLACQFGPRPEPATSPTPTEQDSRMQTPTATLYARQTAQPATTPMVPQGTKPPQATQRITLPTPTKATKTPQATTPAPTSPPGSALLPPKPNAGPLPAVWTEVDLGLSAGNVYFPGSGVLNPALGRAYIVGRCEPEPDYRDGPPPGCLATLDLTSDRVLRTVQVPGGYDVKILIAGDQAYVHPRWGGDLRVLDLPTFAAGETSGRLVANDVMMVAYDGKKSAYAVTEKEIVRLSPDPLAVPLETSYDDSPVALAASADHVFLLGYGTLRVFNSELERQSEFDMRDRSPHAMVLDASQNLAYIGTGSGLWAFDADRSHLFEVPVEDERSEPVAAIAKLALNSTGSQLVAAVRRPADWYGGTSVVLVDMESDASPKHARTLFSALEGQIADILIDEERDRLLLLSDRDHALIPLELETGQARPHLPVGIEVQEVVLDVETERLYVSDSAGWIHVLDRRTYKELDRLYGGRHISLDAQHRRLYAGDPRHKEIIAYDADDLHILWRADRSGKPRAHPVEDQVVVINRRFAILDGKTGQPAGLWQPKVGRPPQECLGCFYTIATEAYIDAQRGLTMTVTYTPWPGKPGPKESIAHDPGSGRAYYSLLTGGYVHYSSIGIYPDLAALQGREEPVLRLEGLSGEIALDLSAHRLYVARGQFLWVVDAETLNRRGRVEASGWQPAIAAVDNDLGRLYSARESALVVWAREGGKPPLPRPPEPAVLTRTVTAILPSPNYAQDLTLLATVNDHLCRSTDGGITWVRLHGGLPTLGEYVPDVHVAFSPDYANDRTLFAGLSVGETHGEGVYCSTDGGDTWSMCSKGLYDLRVFRVIPSPHYAQDRILLAYSRTDKGESLHRSTDGAQSWELIQRQVSYGTPPLPSPEQMFLIADPLPHHRCVYAGQEGVVCERSDDGGLTWQRLDTAQFHMAATVDTALSPDFERDHTAYWITQNAVFRYNDRTGIGEIATIASLYGARDYTNGFADLALADLGEDRHRIFIGTHDGQLYSYPAGALGWEVVWPLPGPEPTPTPCSISIDPRFGIELSWIEDSSCPSAVADTIWMAIQEFEHGLMVWREGSEQEPTGRVYVLRDQKSWQAYPDTWSADQPDRDPGLTPPQGLLQPIRGFGQVWREELGGPDAEIGWAKELERGGPALVQPWERGMLVRFGDERILFLRDDGTWSQFEP